jgi:hypothetical protein
MSRTRAVVGLAAILAVSILPLRLEAVESQNESSGTWSCSLDNLGNTLTLCKSAPNGGYRLYMTDLFAQSTTTTAGLMLIRHGKSVSTGGAAACATDTVSLLPAAATAARIAYPANTAPALEHAFQTPLEVPPNRDLCILATATNTVSVQLQGRLKP